MFKSFTYAGAAFVFAFVFILVLAFVFILVFVFLESEFLPPGSHLSHMLALPLGRSSQCPCQVINDHANQVVSGIMSSST